MPKAVAYVWGRHDDASGTLPKLRYYPTRLVAEVNGDLVLCNRFGELVNTYADASQNGPYTQDDIDMSVFYVWAPLYDEMYHFCHMQEVLWDHTIGDHFTDSLLEECKK